MWDRRDFGFQTESPVTRRIWSVCISMKRASVSSNIIGSPVSILSVESCVKGSCISVWFPAGIRSKICKPEVWDYASIDGVPVQLRGKGKREVLLPQTVLRIWVRFVVVWGGIYVTPGEFPRRNTNITYPPCASAFRMMAVAGAGRKHHELDAVIHWTSYVLSLGNWSFKFNTCK